MVVPFFFRLIFNRFFFQKIFAIVLFITLASVFRSFFGIFLITFLFSYLFLELAHTLHSWVQSSVVRVQNTRTQKFLVSLTSINSLITLLYIGFIVVLGFILSTLVPHLLLEGGSFVRDIPAMLGRVQMEIARLEGTFHLSLGFDSAMKEFFNPDSVQALLSEALQNLKNAGIFLFEFILALMLSYIFLMDRHRIGEYLATIRHTHFAFLYDEYRAFFSKVGRGFGLVFKAQSFIAIANALLTVLGLVFISFAFGKPFPYMVTLALIVFVFGFIPVLGTFLSSVPILIIAYTYGGVPAVLSVVAMVTFVHAVEAYYLNPRIVSSYMELPVFLTFVILLVSERLFGLVGLLVGVPLFSILTEVLRDFDSYVGRVQNVREAIEQAENNTHEALEDGKTLRMSRSGKRQTDEE